ncbi:MAG: D-alanyl-D-alanine endopeptidase [Gammaproteobacteria bacterium]|nr:D-alanyl-D-alanine endopeptidase [Gammaproteobacteria bacterium]
MTSRRSTRFLLVLVLGSLWSTATTAATINTPSAISLASVSAVTADVETGELLVAKHADAVMSIASITKLMTAMVVLDSGTSLDEWVPIGDWESKLGKNAYSRIRITSEARRADLLRIALMSSENRAAYNLGLNHPGGMDAFISEMNAKAKSLGMTQSNFVDPMGLSPDNRSTARDLARMVTAAHQYPEIRDYSTTRQHTVRFRAPRYKLGYGNTNPLTGSSRWNVLLSKTGYLKESGRCLVMVTEADGHVVAMVMLNSLGTRSPLGDAGRMRRYLETGAGGNVAKAARDYERRMIRTYGLDTSSKASSKASF